MPPLPTTLGDPLRPILSESERMQQALHTVLCAGLADQPDESLLRKYHTDAEFHAAVYIAAQMQLRAEDADQTAWDGIAAMRSPWAGTIGMLGRPTTDGRRIDELLLLNPVPLVALGRYEADDDLERRTVGVLTGVTADSGAGELRGEGWLNALLLPLTGDRRSFGCGMEVDIPDGRMRRDGDLLVVESATLRHLVLYLSDDLQPAWPGCAVTVQ